MREPSINEVCPNVDQPSARLPLCDHRLRERERINAKFKKERREKGYHRDKALRIVLTTPLTLGARTMTGREGTDCFGLLDQDERREKG